jgi:hypothetical protein
MFRTGLPIACCFAAAGLAAQIPTGHHLVLTGTASGGSALLDVDPGSGLVTPLRSFTLDALPPLACTWDPVGRHAIVAVRAGIGSVLFRVDPASAFERFLAVLPDPVLGLEISEPGDLYALTGGPNGAIWEIARNGSAPSLRIAAPHATAFGAPKRAPVCWIAQAPPGAAPTIGFVDPRLGSVLVPPIALPALAGRRITGVHDLPTGAPRQVLTDDRGGIHLLEFGTTLSTLPVAPTLPPGATVDLLLESGTSLDAVVLGDRRHPFVQRVPVFGAPPVAVPLAGPLPGDPIDIDEVDSAAGGSFGSDCGGSFGAKGLFVVPGWPGYTYLRHAPPLAPALVVFGLSEQETAGIPLPALLPGGCSLLVSLDVLVPTRADAAGNARIDFPVPASLPPGFAIHAQWILPTPNGLGTTCAMSIQIG